MMNPELSVRRIEGPIVDQWSVYWGPVRVAIVTDTIPPRLVKGAVDNMAEVEKLIAKKSRLKGGLC